MLILAIVLVFMVLLFEFGDFAAPHGGAVLGAAIHLRRVPGAAGHRHDVQPGFLHGADHGDRHRGQERHPAAGRRPEIPRGRPFARREL